MEVTLYEIAHRFVGLGEIAGATNNGFIQWAHSLCGLDPETPDEVPWCSSWLNAMAWIADMPRSKSPAARSWLKVGEPIAIELARPMNDVVVFKRGNGPQPGPEVLNAPGHVGVYHGVDGAGGVLVLGGNQGNAVSIARYPLEALLGVRRIGP